MTLLAAALLTPTLQAQSQLLYQTDFETFPVGGGPNKLVGIDGWVGSGVGTSLAAGIDQDVGGGTGRSAYIGFNPPPAGTTFVSVRRPVNFSPITAARPIVEFTALIGISDSSGANTNKDRFYLTIYNSSLQALAWLSFDNTTTDHFIFRYDGVTSTNTGSFFLASTVQFLSVKINYLTNRWSASLDFAPMFIDAPFHSGSRSKDLGAVAAEWKIVNLAAGNNWMFFDDWSLSATVESSPEVDVISKSAAGVSVSWLGELGYSYRVQYTNDLSTSWLDTLPNSLVTPSGSTQMLTYTDATVPAGKRFYRIKRTVAAQ